MMPFYSTLSALKFVSKTNLQKMGTKFCIYIFR